MKRNVVFDAVKGFAIIAVIVGHLDNPDGNLLYKVIHKFIYSFHMPLFFIISGYFFKCKTFLDDFQRLVVPYLFTTFLCVIVVICINYDKDLSSQMMGICNILERALWGSGGDSNAPFLGKIPDFLPVWFLLALFWGKQVFKYITNSNISIKKQGVICLAISVLFTYLDRNVINLPWSINEGMSAIIFVFIGSAAKKQFRKGMLFFVYKKNLLIYLICFIIFNLPVGTIVLAGCQYQCYVLNVIGATCTTWLLCFIFGSLYRKTPAIICTLSDVGRFSLIILCTHSVLIESKICYPSSSMMVHFLLSVFCAIIGAWLLSRIGFVRKLFRI